MVATKPITIEAVAEVLRVFMLSEISASSLQPVLELGALLNPDLRLCDSCRRPLRTPEFGPRCRRCVGETFNRR